MFQTILAVDDSDVVLNTFRLQVKMSSGVKNILTAGDGIAAIKVLKANPDIDGIFLDINMPIMDGLTFLRFVREDRNYDAVPVVMLTTEGRDDTIAEAMDLGANAYLTKPFRKREVVDTIARLRQELA